MKAWLRLEVRASLPYLAAAAALGLLGPAAAARLLAALGRDLPGGTYLPARVASDPAGADLLGIATACLLLLAAEGATRAEGADRSVQALLPVSGRRLWAARALALLGVALAAPLARHGGHAAAQAWVSWAPGLGRDVVLPLLGGEALSAMGWGAVGLALAPLGRGSWIVAGGLLLASRAASVAGPPVALEWDPWGVVRPDPAGSAALLGAAALIGALLRARPRRAPRASGAGRRRVGRRTWSPAFLGLLAVGLPLAALAAPATGERREGPRATSWTERFVFEVDLVHIERARPLIERADRVHDAVAAALGVAPDLPNRPSVRLVTGPPRAEERRTAIRLLRPEASAFALAVESARALLQQTAGGRRLSAWGPAGEVVGEGLCRHVALRASGLDPAWSRFQVALVHARRPIALREVFDGRLAGARGQALVPALGEALVAAAVRLRGEAAIPRLLAALAAAPAAPPRGPVGSEVAWEAVLSAATLPRAPLRERLMEVIEESPPPQDPRARAPLPRLSLAVGAQEEPLGFRLYAIPDLDVPPGWRVVCRARRRPPHDPAAADAPCWPAGRDPSGARVFVVPAHRFQAPPWVQLGLTPVEPVPLLGTVWEEWSPPPGPP